MMASNCKHPLIFKIYKSIWKHFSALRVKLIMLMWSKYVPGGGDNEKVSSFLSGGSRGMSGGWWPPTPFQRRNDLNHITLSCLNTGIWHTNQLYWGIAWKFSLLVEKIIVWHMNLSFSEGGHLNFPFTFSKLYNFKCCCTTMKHTSTPNYHTFSGTKKIIGSFQRKWKYYDTVFSHLI